MFDLMNDRHSKYKILFIPEAIDKYNKEATSHKIGNITLREIFNNIHKISEQSLADTIHTKEDNDEICIVSYFSSMPITSLDGLISFAKANNKISTNVITDFGIRVNNELNRLVDKQFIGLVTFKFIIYNTSHHKSIFMCTVSYKIRYSFIYGYYKEFLSATCSKYAFYQTNYIGDDIIDIELDDSVD